MQAALADLATELNLIDKPTRVTETTSTTIDLLFSTNASQFAQSGCAHSSLSDHHMIYGVWKTRVPRSRSVHRELRCLAKCNIEELLADLVAAPWSLLDSCEDVNEMWECWKHLFFHVLDSHASLDQCRNPSTAPNENLLSQKGTKTKDPCDWEKYRKLRNRVGKTLRKAEKEYFEEVTRIQGNPRAVWKDLNKVIGRGQREHIATIQVKGRDIVRNRDKAEEFNKYFVNCIPHHHLLIPGL